MLRNLKNGFSWGQKYIKQKIGFDILSSYTTNKIQSFNSKERDRLRISGLLPEAEFSIEEQMGTYMNEYWKGLKGLYQ